MLRQLMQKRLLEAGVSLTPAEMGVLHLLSHDDGQRVGVFADHTTRERTVMTRIADRLVGKGLVERREDPEDRRAVCLWLTDAGRSLHGEMAPVRDAVSRQISASLSPGEQKKLTAALEALRERMIRLIEED